MDRLNTILHSLRRRDNIRDFIDGLEDSECWPYPDGETRPIPAMIECCACCSEPFELEVNIRKEKIEELTHLYLTDIYRFHTFAPFGETSRRQIELADISIELCPEEGVGAYAVSYEAANEANRIGAPKMNLSDVAMIRSAFMHRYEWVVNKFHSVNRDRLEARKRFKAGDEHLAPSDEEQSEAALSEEEDHDAFLLNEGCGGEGEESEGDEDDALLDTTLVVVQPDAKPARDPCVSSEQVSSDGEMGRDPANAPSATVKRPATSWTDSSAHDSDTTLIDFGSGVMVCVPRKRARARERSVKL